jgi:hypothetical protein
VSKKAKLYLLIIINLIAWGYVGYRIYGALQGDDDVAFESINMPLKKINEDKKEDSVVLILNYEDPFLKGGNYAKENIVKTSHSSSNKSINHNSKPLQERKVETTPVSLDIKYIGLVKNNDKGTQTALISINGKSYFVKSKDVVEGFTVLEITKDFINLKKGKNKIQILI